MAGQPFITLQQVNYTYPGTRKTPAQTALEDITLDVAQGEAAVLLGPNGSGKSTLLRLLMTALKPQQGRLAVGGFDLASRPDQVRRLISVVFQKPALDRRMSVAENLWTSGVIYGVERGPLRRRIAQLLEQVGLQERSADKVETLSGGLARRAELAKALLSEPRLLILDEPTTGLDPIARAEFWQYLEEVRRQTGLTVIATTHLLEEAEGFERVAILHRGKLLAFAPPHALQSQVGGQVLTLKSAALPQLRDAIQAHLGIGGKVVGDTLHLPLERDISLDELRRQFGDLIQAINWSHPSLDDVFVHFTGHYLSASTGESQ